MKSKFVKTNVSARKRASKGKRYTQGKPAMHLIPMDALVALAEHYGRGAEKYAPRNWENGLKWNEECASSLLRHLAAWSQGEEKDVEGFYHDVAILWNAMALVTYRLRETGTDDRATPKKNPRKRKPRRSK